MSNNVFVVVLNWNRKDDTLECLQSLNQFDFGFCQVVLVDNGSTDETVSAVQKQYPNIHIVANEKNLGFAKGSNQGINYALAHGADWILLLNNDTIVAPDMLTKLVQAGNSSSKIGIVAPKIYYYHQPTTIWSAGSTSHCFPPGRVTLTGLGKPDGVVYNRQLLLDYVIGCAMLVKKEVFSEVGLLDERFFMFFEDYDFCRRVTSVGYDILFVPSAKMWHKDGASTHHNPGLRWVYMGFSTTLFYKKHFSWWQFSLGLYVIWVIFREIFNGNHHIVKAYLQGVYQGINHSK